MVHKFDGSSKMNISQGLCYILRRMNAWLSFKDIIKNFLGNTHAGNYTEIIQKLLESYKVLGCNMSITLHCLHCHLVNSLEDLGTVNNEQGEQFHQDLKIMEECYQDRWDVYIMGYTITGASNAIVFKLTTPETAININFYLNCLYTIIIEVAISFVKT